VRKVSCGKRDEESHDKYERKLVTEIEELKRKEKKIVSKNMYEIGLSCVLTSLIYSSTSSKGDGEEGALAALGCRTLRGVVGLFSGFEARKRNLRAGMV
jgi:hypothetical protein